MSRFRITLAAAALAIAAGSAQAQVVTFGAGTNGPFVGPVNESGFTYSEFSGSLYSNTLGNPSGDLEGYSFENGGVVSFVSSSAGDFTFEALDYAAYFNAGTGSQTLNLSGYLNGSLVGSDSFNLANTASFFGGTYANWTTFAAVGLAGLTIDELRITLNGFGSSESYQAIDNVTFGPVAAVPEPSAWAMMLFGFGAIGFAMRHRRKTALRTAAA